MKYVTQFRMGDLVTGLPETVYGIANDQMREAEVIGLNEWGVSVRVITHDRHEFEGTILKDLKPQLLEISGRESDYFGNTIKLNHKALYCSYDSIRRAQFKVVTVTGYEGDRVWIEYLNASGEPVRVKIKQKQIVMMEESLVLNDGMFSSKTDKWATPQELFDTLNAEFGFTLDPCASEDNAKCAKFYTEEDDGLSKDWDGETVFCNPPYGRVIGQWVKKCYETKGIRVALLPARTDTAWFHDYINGLAEIRFIRRRIKFGDSKTDAPFPSMIVIWRN